MRLGHLSIPHQLITFPLMSGQSFVQLTPFAEPGYSAWKQNQEKGRVFSEYTLKQSIPVIETKG